MYGIVGASEDVRQHHPEKQSTEQVEVAAGHERATAMDGTANLIAQVIARIAPISIDSKPTEQGDGDVAIRGTGEPAIERLQDDAKAPAASLRRDTPCQEILEEAEIVKRLQRC